MIFSLIFVGLVCSYALVATRLDHLGVTGPITFALGGLALGIWGADLVDLTPYSEVIRVVTGLTLALLLFSDASSIGLRGLREDASVISLLLFMGLPLTIAIGTLAAWLILPAMGIGMAALLAAILAPTDLSLGLAMFKSPTVPKRVRRTLNVESGLNDGIAAPMVALFLAVALAELTNERRPIAEAVAEMAIGLGVGMTVGLVGGYLSGLSQRLRWSSVQARQYAAAAFALLAYVVSLAIDGNGFIAAFVGGICFGAVIRAKAVEDVDYAEKTGTLLTLLVWFVFGAVIGPVLRSDGLHWQPFVYAVASLTIVRLLAVVLPLRIKRMHWSSVLFIGWFGPRGLASVTFLLLAVISLDDAGIDNPLFTATAGWTILLSVVLHGISAAPVASWYSSRAAKFAPGSPELEPVVLSKTRHGISSPTSRHQSD